MTLDEKRRYIGDWCDGQYLTGGCDTCKFDKVKDPWCRDYNEFNIPEDVCDCTLDLIGVLIDEPTEESVEEPITTVNHPPHYNREGSMECIDEMVLLFGKSVVKSFCLCNAWKYRYRAADKNREEDIAKSDWYIQKYKELS